jgi:hypothetical protein
MNWYLAKLVFQVRSGEGTHTPQFDGQWRLIRADEVSWAYEKATVLGRLDETSQLNHKDERVTWKFIEVTDIILIGEFKDGEQIFSTTEEPVNPESYIQSVKIHAKKSFALAQQVESAAQIGSL